MVSKRIQKALEGNSAIRAMFNEGREMAAKYGEENVFDFSLGNPATPAPKALNDAIRDLLDEADAKGAAGSLGIHGYMANAGYEEVRQAIAENLNERFGTKFTAHNLVMTVAGSTLFLRRFSIRTMRSSCLHHSSENIASMRRILMQRL